MAIWWAPCAYFAPEPLPADDRGGRFGIVLRGLRAETTKRLTQAPPRDQPPKGPVPDGCKGLAFSPDGAYLAGVRETDAGRGQVLLWDLRGREVPKVLREDVEFFGHNLTFSPGGRWLVLASKTAITALDLRTVGNAVALECSKTGGFPFGIRYTISPDDRLLAAPDVHEGEDRIVIWDLARGAVQARIVTDAGPWNLAFSPDGRRLAASSDGTVSFFRVATGQEEWRQTIPEFRRSGLLRCQADGLRLYSTKDAASLVLWEPAWDIPQFECAVMRDEDFAFSPDGESLMIFAPKKAEQPAKLKLLRWRDGTVREGVAVNQSPGWRGPPVCSRDGRQCAVFTEAGLCVVYEAATGKETARLKWPAPSGGFSSGAFTAAGHFLAYARDSVWDVTAGTKVWQAPEGQQIDGLSQDGRYLCVVPAGVFHDGNGVMVGKISIWDLALNQKVGGLQGAEEAGLGLNEPLFSPDGRWLFAPAAPFEPSESFKGAVWSVPDGRKQLTIRGPAALIRGYTFSADGKLLALCQMDGGAQLCDLGRAELLFRWKPKPHEGHVGHNLAFAPGGTALAEQGFDEESVTVLDLNALRRRLAMIGLDW